MPERIPSREARRLLATVTAEFRTDLRRMIGGTVLGPHLQPLLRSILDRRRLGLLLHYGMHRLPADDRRPDDALAAYFLVISELKTCPRSVRILATKCTEYCESEARDGWSDSLADLKRAYAALTNIGIEASTARF